MTVKLRSKADYQMRELSYKAGQVLQVDEDVAAFLLRDAPENFELVEGEPAELRIRDLGQGPPADKEIKRPAVKK